LTLEIDRARALLVGPASVPNSDITRADPDQRPTRGRANQGHKEAAMNEFSLTSKPNNCTKCGQPLGSSAIICTGAPGQYHVGCAPVAPNTELTIKPVGAVARAIPALREVPKVVDISTDTAKVQAEIVKAIEGALEKAKAGEFFGFSYAASTRDGEAVTCFTRSVNCHPLISAISLLQFRICQRHWERDEG
jgi:hypothetical protein